jgi:hypothetical protein
MPSLHLACLDNQEEKHFVLLPALQRHMLLTPNTAVHARLAIMVIRMTDHFPACLPCAVCCVCSPALAHRGAPEFVPPSVLAQINRWSIVLPSWLFRGLIDLGRPSDISLYHISCFDLVLARVATAHLWLLLCFTVCNSSSTA